MLYIKVPASELWDERNERFIRTKEQTLCLEHSLVSVSKWESTWCKPFLTDVVKTTEEIIDYIRCMTLTQNVDPNVYFAITNDNIRQVDDYINNPMTATTFYDDKDNKANNEIITNELMYYWMFTFGIPIDCQKWHFNRLLTLIRVFSAKNKKPKPMTVQQRAELNAARKKQYNTKG